MGLHVRKTAVEQLLGAIDCDLLGDVDPLAAAVVAAAWITLGVFVGEHGALRLEYGAAHDVLRRDQLDLVPLAAKLAFDREKKFRIALLEGGRKKAVNDMAVRRDVGHGHSLAPEAAGFGRASVRDPFGG